MRGRLRIESSTLAWIGLALLLLFTAATVLRETRGTALWFDEWGWVLDRRGGGLGSLLKPHNGHFSLVPLLIYRALFATVGIDDYTPYRVMVVIGHLTVGALLFVYASRRIGPLAALLPTALLLTLGPAWQNFLWPFQIAWLISLGAGLGALLALDREDRRGDAVACGLLALSLASSGVGIAVAAGIVVEVVLRRRPWWVVFAPLGLYAVWWVAYQETDFFRHNLVLAPQFASEAAGGALAAVTGLTEGHLDAGGQLIDAGAALVWGRPLLLAAVAVLIWRLAAMRPVPARVFALLAMAVTFWVLGGVQRAEISAPDASRYLYVGALFVLLLAVELARGVTVSRGIAALLVVLTGVVVVANLGDLRAGARNLRAQALIARADLGALELARADLPPGYDATHFPGTPFVELDARHYLAAARALGSPAFSPAQIATVPNEEARLAADEELAAIEGVVLRPGAGARRATAPPVATAKGGQVTTGGGCVRFRAGPVTAAGEQAELEVAVPPGGLLLTAEGAPASVGLRRFAVGYSTRAESRLAPGGSATLRPGRDRVTQPWRVRLTTQGGVRACSLAPAG